MKFQINVTNMCMLCLAGGQSSLDDLLYLEALYTKLDADSSCCKVFHSIHLKIISESQPEYRYKIIRFIRKNNSNELKVIGTVFLSVILFYIFFFRIAVLNPLLNF